MTEPVTYTGPDGRTYTEWVTDEELEAADEFWDRLVANGGTNDGMGGTR